MRHWLILCSLLVATTALAGSRLDSIRARGQLQCWVSDDYPGFAERVGGEWRGFEVDLCRALAAAVLGDADAVALRAATTLPDFLADHDADIVLRRLTATARREQPGQVAFGPVLLYDAQGLLLDRRQAARKSALAGRRICVGANPAHLRALQAWAARLQPAPRIVVVDDSAGLAGLNAWREAGCAAWSSDLTALLALRQATPEPQRYRLDAQIFGLEPLAPLLKDDDAEFARLVRWLFDGLIALGNGDRVELDAELAAQLQFAPGGWQAARAVVSDMQQLTLRHFGPGGRLPLPWVQTTPWQATRLPAPAGPALR